MQPLQCALCSVQCVVLGVQCEVCNVYFAVCFVHCAVCCLQCAVCSVDEGKRVGLGAGVSGGLPGMKYCTATQCIAHSNGFTNAQNYVVSITKCTLMIQSSARED